MDLSYDATMITFPLSTGNLPTHVRLVNGHNAELVSGA